MRWLTKNLFLRRDTLQQQDLQQQLLQIEQQYFNVLTEERQNLCVLRLQQKNLQSIQKIPERDQALEHELYKEKALQQMQAQLSTLRLDREQALMQAKVRLETLQSKNVSLRIFQRIFSIRKGVFTTKIASPPGHFYSMLGRIILNNKTYDRILEQSIATMQEEYFEAYSQGSYNIARWIKMRFFFEFLMILGLNLPVVKQLLDITQKLAK